LFQALRQHNTDAIADLVRRNEVEKLIRDARAVPVASRGKSGDMVEVSIPGYIGNVVTPKMNLIGR
jgi:hypothetical protein